MASDRRLAVVRHLNMHYKFPGYATKEEWLARAAEIKEHILVSTGLVPQPKKCPLKARVFGKIERDGYTIEKVYFQSYPGFFVTGNLYRPRGKQGPFPGILTPHGHWAHGRLENQKRGSVPGRCINFARQGYVVFTYDMVGYTDSKQVDHRRWGGDREHLWGVSPMGLQLWNSIRSVDFLQSLPDVDPDRLGCTGASGGGTQTFMLMAVDDRIKVAAPVNMISAYMQGGCVCENAPGLRTILYNVEIGAMMAPRPLLLVSATGDWTKHTPTEEYPDIRTVYALFHATDRVESVQVDAPHNYNQASREAVYAFFGKWLLGDKDAARFKERPFRVEPAETLRVFPDNTHAPGALSRRRLISELERLADARLESLRPKSKRSLRRFCDLMRPALRHALSCRVPDADAVRVLQRTHSEAAGEKREELVLTRTGQGDRVHCLLIQPRTTSLPRLTVAASPKGIAGLAPDGHPDELVTRLLRAGSAVLAVDCFLPEGAPDPRNLAGIHFFTTYNLTNTANRVQDLLTALTYAGKRRDLGAVSLVGVGEAGLWALLAQALCPTAKRVVADTAGFGTRIDRDYLTRLYVPNLRRVGDFRTVAALVAPVPLFLHDTAGRFRTDWYRSIYDVLGAKGNLQITRGPVDESQQVRWIVRAH